MESKNRERRIAEVVKSILSKTKDKLLSSSSLLFEEQVAFDQLEKLYVIKFLRVVPENGIGLCRDSESESTKEGHISASVISAFTPRRDSDASASNDTNLSCSTLKNSTLKNYYNGKDPWRRQWQRRQRLELRSLLKPLPLRVDEARGISLQRNIASIYDEMLLQGKPPLTAYDLLITTLRSYYARDTWPELVEVYVGRFIESSLLLTPEQLAQKHRNGARFVGSVDKTDEYKLQVLLCLHVLSTNVTSNCESESTTLNQVLDLLRAISVADTGSVVEKFLDEDILETFLGSLPEYLARLYEILAVSVPVELQSYSTNGNRGKSEKNTTQGEAMCKTKCMGTKAVKEVLQKPTMIQRSLEEFFPSDSDKVKNKRKPEKRTRKEASPPEKKKVTITQKAKNMEPKSDDPPPSKRRIVDDDPKDKTVASSISEVLVSVRQSPRQHASTRALYGGTANALSILLKKDNTEDGVRNGCLMIPAMTTTTTDISNDMTRLVLVKDKRGYFLKKFLHNNQNDEDEIHMVNGLSTSKKTGKELAVTSKRIKKSVKLTISKTVVKNSGKTKVVVAKEECDETLESPVRTNTRGSKAKPQKSNGIVQRSDARENIKSKLRRTVSPLNCGTSYSVKSKTNDIRLCGSPDKVDTATKPTPITPPKRDVSCSKEYDDMPKLVKANDAPDDSSNAVTYELPEYAAQNYSRYVNGIRRERKRGKNDLSDGEELFYARGTRRYSIFYDGAGESDSNTKAPISKCYSDEHMAPKSRSGRKMKSSTEVFHLANYLLNAQNENPSTPTIPRNLQQALNTPIRLYKKLRLASKSSRRRSSKQFCALKFNTDEFKLSDHGSGTCASSMASEERTTSELDECGSEELNCGEVLDMPTGREQRRHLAVALTVDTTYDDNRQKRNSFSACSLTTNRSSQTWNVTLDNAKLNMNDTSNSNYFSRRRRLFSDGCVSMLGSSLKSPDSNGSRMMTRRFSAMWEERHLEMGIVKSAETKVSNGLDHRNGLMTGSFVVTTKGISNSSAYLLDKSHGMDKNTISNDGLLQLANSALLCTNMSSKNYATVVANVH